VVRHREILQRRHQIAAEEWEQLERRPLETAGTNRSPGC
jgi:hypothetical protein